MPQSFDVVVIGAGGSGLRAALLAELRRQKWSLVATGAALAMGGSANVVRAIHKLGLDAEHRAARIRKITAG